MSHLIAELKRRVAELEEKNADLEARLGHEQVVTTQNPEARLQGYIRDLGAQVAALQEIAIGERAGFLHYRASCYDPGRRCPYAKGCDDCTGWDTCSALDRFNADARRQLAEEHPEAFR